MPIIIGITGMNGSGKDSVAEILKTGYDFEHYSAREMISNEMMRLAASAKNRDDMREGANMLAVQLGPDFLIKQLLAETEKKQSDSVFESVRRTAEIQAIWGAGGKIIAVLASREVRFRRLKARGGKFDDITFDQFVDQENKELDSTDPNRQSIVRCVAMANFRVENEGAIENLYDQINTIMSLSFARHRTIRK